jgi:hypothetical protein
MPDTNEEKKVDTVSHKSEQETFSREYVSELRKESAAYRVKLQEMEKVAKDAQESAERVKKEEETKRTETQKQADERILRSELKAIALKAGMIDTDGLKLADLSKVKLLETGEIEGADALMEDLKKSKPYLFGQTQNSTSTDKKPKPADNKPKLATEMTPEEYAAEKKKLIAATR